MERLSDEDYAYHQYVIAQLQEAESAKNQWFRYLALKYNLTAGQVIRPDGVITTAD